MRLFGSFLAFAPVIFAFMPVILVTVKLRRTAPLWLTLSTGALPFQVQSGKLQQFRIVSKVTNAKVAPLTKGTANGSGFMIVVYDDRAAQTANHTHAGFSGLESFLAIFGPDPIGQTGLLPIDRSARSAPAIQTVLFLVVQREKFSRFRLFLAASCACQHLTSHLRRALLIRLLGSAALAAPVSFSFIPHILLLKFSRL